MVIIKSLGVSMTSSMFRATVWERPRWKAPWLPIRRWPGEMGDVVENMHITFEGFFGKRALCLDKPDYAWKR
ncbi:MAG: hypothetical protein NTU69_10810 [Proteobacteria bacterium]|nr:hypothetical protein [Pseudomonadota bacterium]